MKQTYLQKSTIEHHLIQRISRIKTQLILLFVAVFLSSCQWMAESYVGLNMQPNTSKNDFTPGLNVFGVLKVGETFDTINHYFEVQKLQYLKDQFDSINVNNAQIELTCFKPSGEIKIYQLTNHDSGIYFNPSMEINPGERWEFVCTADTFKVTSECVIPNIPQVSIINRNLKKLDIEIQKDSSAFIYDVYLFSADNFYFDRMVAQQTGNTKISISTSWEIKSGQTSMFVFAYDKQFETYFSTSSIFFKPNAYRPPYSVVNGGFGVFGSIASKKIEL